MAIDRAPCRLMTFPLLTTITHTGSTAIRLASSSLSEAEIDNATDRAIESRHGARDRPHPRAPRVNVSCLLVFLRLVVLVEHVAHRTVHDNHLRRRETRVRERDSRSVDPARRVASRLRRTRDRGARTTVAANPIRRYLRRARLVSPLRIVYQRRERDSHANANLILVRIVLSHGS